MTHSSARLRLAAMAAALVVATFVVYFQVRDFRFLYYDDARYIHENPRVVPGLSVDGIAWAFTTPHAANWHPLTWMSHMADVELFGLDAGGHHLVNVVLHAVNAVLLLFLLFRLTGSPWRSGFVAALFALHPLHVESVAWVSERKDVLCALFCLLALRAYVGYAARGGKGPYLASLASFALALLSKPMAVTLPFLLLLLDFWPLGRLRPVPNRRAGGWGAGVPALRLVVEKVPFFLFSILSSVVTYVVQARGGTVDVSSVVPMGVRIANALTSYAAYLVRTIWPVSLSAFYPHPWETMGGAIPVAEVAAAVVLLAGITAVSLWRLGSSPCLAFGWFWYLGMLVPVIGVVAVGAQARADRYTYMPLIGIFIALAWGLPDLPARWRSGRRALAAGLCVVLVGLAAVSRNQVSYWRDDLTLFGHATEIDPGNVFAHKCVGLALLRQGRTLEAIARLERALSTDYNYHAIDTLLGLAEAFINLRMYDRADAYLRRGLAIQNSAKLRIGLADLYFCEGRRDDAIREMREAVSLDPDNLNARRALEELESARGPAPR